MLNTLFHLLSVPCDNPAFPASLLAARADLDRAAALGAATLARPIVVLSGYHSPAIPARRLAGVIVRHVGGSPKTVRCIAYPLVGEIPRAVERVVNAVEGWWPSDDAEWTTAVDVVAISMGGLVARAAAAGAGVFGPESFMPGRARVRIGKRLRMARLFTLGTPHRGAVLAETVALDPAANDMLAGSAFLKRLDGALEGAEYDLTCYARLRDGFVGATRAAPLGREPIWTSGLLLGSHFSISEDVRIQADLCRRLRGEAGLGQASEPPPTD